ncbi:MAG: 2-hydroxyacyl-CoA dehydratase, partial [Candidatus Tectomicrobia bacterium]|nr:2-hydroxyacyl-CoA dehydratase [Candidatus Tectomicrobia bacterium]
MQRAKLTELEELLRFYQNARREMGEDPPDEKKINALTFECLIDYLEETLRVADEGKKKIGWFGPGITREPLLAMDIHPYRAELMVGLLPTSRPEALRKYVDIAENAGLPAEMCSIDRGAVGLILSGQLPAPSFIVGASLPCDNIVIGYQIYNSYLGVPSYHPDAPYGDDEESIRYYADQLKKMIAFMEEQTGKKMDWDRLKEIIEESNRAYEYLLETNELRKAVPCPQSGRLLTMSNFLNSVGAGLPKGTAVFRQIHEDARKRARLGQGVVEEERSRAIWFMLPTYFDLSIFDWMEQEFGAVIVMDMFSYAAIRPVDTSTPESMLRGLAVKALNMPMARQLRGPTEFYTDDLVRVCEEYRADSVIYAGHEGCKHGWGIVGLIRDTCK